jgi:hypothetical protein
LVFDKKLISLEDYNLEFQKLIKIQKLKLIQDYIDEKKFKRDETSYKEKCSMFGHDVYIRSYYLPVVLNILNVNLNNIKRFLIHLKYHLILFRRKLTDEKINNAMELIEKHHDLSIIDVLI